MSIWYLLWSRETWELTAIVFAVVLICAQVSKQKCGLMYGVPLVCSIVLNVIRFLVTQGVDMVKLVSDSGYDYLGAIGLYYLTLATGKRIKSIYSRLR